MTSDEITQWRNLVRAAIADWRASGSVLEIDVLRPGPEAPDASDECRLAAGWTQQLASVTPASLLVSASKTDVPTGWQPAPSPAGKWRIQGTFTVRWVMPIPAEAA